MGVCLAASASAALVTLSSFAIDNRAASRFLHLAFGFPCSTRLAISPATVAQL
jgi:hypothetical protein